MQDDEFESSHAGNDTHRQNRQKKNQLDDEEHPHKRSRDRQKATAIALSVITCLFMCVIGYEIIRENSPKADEPQANAEPARPSLMLSKMSIRDHNQYLADDDGDDVYENHQIRLLQEQNRKQANKIKGLRQELLEKMQAMHDIKANLFKQEGDPRDRAKIADLSQKLDEKEKVVATLTANMKTIETELSALQRKIEHAEVTRDALASMIETQRTTKEQERANAHKQIEELKNASQEESAQLKEAIVELEKTLLVLDIAYREKNEALEQINQELSDSYELLNSKTNEHQSLAELYQETRDMMTKQVLDLIASLEWEAASKTRITQKLQNQLEKLDLEKTSVINLLEAELQKRNEIIALKEANENLHRNSMGFTANESQEQVLNLIATLEFEMTRTSYLQKDLDRAIYVHRQHLDDKGVTITNLEHDLKKQKLILESKGEELENLWSVLHLTREEHRQKISDLVASHELESLRVNELQNKLGEHYQEKGDLLQKQEVYLADLQQLKTANTELARQLTLQEQETNQARSARIDELEEVIAALKQNVEAKDTLLAARQLELHALMASEAETAQQLRKQASELSHQIEAGNFQLMQMHAEILSLIPHKESHQAQIVRIRELDDTIQALTKELAEKEQVIAESQQELQNIIHSHGTSDKNLREHIHNLSIQLETETLRLAKLDSELQDSLASQSNYEENLQRLDELETISQAFRNELSAKEADLAESQEELHNLNEVLAATESALKQQIHELTAILDEETNKLTALEDELRRVATSHANGEERSAELEAKLREAHLQTSALEAELQKVASYHSNSEERTAELEAKLQDAQQHTSALEVELQRVASSHSNSEERSAELDAKLQEAQQQASALEHKIKSYQSSLIAREQEIETLAESKYMLEQSLIDQINDLEAQIAHEQNKTDTLQQKIKDRHAQHTEQSKQLRDFELQIGSLNNQLYEKEKELLATEEKLLLTLPQLDLLSTENQHLHNTHGEYDQKIQETTHLIHTQQKQIQELVDRLNEEQNLFKQTLAKQAEHARHSQESAKKLELTNLRAALLEDQLTINDASLRRYEEAIAKLKQSQSELKEDYELQLEVAKAELDREKEFSKSLNKDNQRLVSDYLKYQDHAQKMESALEKSHESIANLENEIQSLRQNIAKQDELINQKDQSASEYKVQEGTIAELKKHLENEKQKSKAIEADLKKVISAYNAEKQKLKESNRREPVANY